MTNPKRSVKIDMTEGAILPKMLRFALPIMAASILQLLFNAADIAVVGRFCGDNALAAVSSNGSMVQLLTNLFIGFSTGANVLVSRYYAAKEEQNLTETVHTAMLLAVLSGIVATIVGICSARAFLTMMQSPADVIDLAALYLRIYFIGSVPVIVYNFGAAILRAVGDTQRPLYILMASGVLNVVLNLIFVLVFHMSVAGVALATILSQTLSAVLVIRCLMREEGAIRLVPRALRIVPDKLKKVLQIGFPAGIQSTLFSISNVVIQSSINSFGSITMSGNGAAENIEGFGYMAFNAFYQAILSFTSQNYGKKRYRRILRVQLVGQLCAAVVCLLFGILILFFGRNLLAIYSDTPRSLMRACSASPTSCRSLCWARPWICSPPDCAAWAIPSAPCSAPSSVSAWCVLSGSPPCSSSPRSITSAPSTSPTRSPGGLPPASTSSASRLSCAAV